jgi:hypothetical protein
VDSNIPRIAYKDFLINQKEPKRTDKNYVDFWLKHIDYCKSGVYVGGIYISGWLYWHLNFFKIPLDKKDEWGNKVRVVGNPPLRDNEYYMDWGKRQAVKQQKPIIIFGSRRIAKSTTLASEISYQSYIFRNSQSIVIGGSSTDINNIKDYFIFFYEVRPDCFSDLRKVGDWTKEGGNVEIAFSKRESTKVNPSTKKKGEINPISYKLLDIGEDNKYIFSIIGIRNLEHGAKSSKEELLAGLTPSKVILDEALAHYTPIPTPTGWTTMEDLQVGTFVFNKHREPVEVVRKVDVGIKPLYRVILSNGSYLDACEDHNWEVLDSETLKRVKTKDILASYDDLAIYCEDIKDYLYIDDISLIGESQAYCITVKDKDSLFLAGNYITTGNCGKYDYALPYAALKPAFMDSEGEYRTIPLLVGTGGNIDKSTSAERDFLGADKNDFTVIDIQHYLQEVNEEYFRYKQQSDLKVSLFPMAEMSNAGGKKLEIPLHEYVKKEYTKQDLKDLEGFTIHVTDWDNARERVIKEIKKEENKSDAEGKKAQMYYPFQPEDCFLYSGSNPFPVEEAKKTQKTLEETGMSGEFAVLSQDEQGRVIVNGTDKDIVRKYPFEGGSYDAPVVIYERPISEDPMNIKYGTYVAGFDGYKIGTSETTDSLGTLHIFKRNAGISGYRNQVVASYASRPPQESKFHRQVYLLLKMYNAEVLPERDTSLHNYLKGINQLKYIANCKNLAEGITPNTKADHTYGLAPTQANKEHILKLIQDYCNEEIVVGFTEEDEPIYMKGVERIHDTMLLEEIIQFGKFKNYDRIISFGHALAWNAELGSMGYTGGSLEGTKQMTADSLIKHAQKKRMGRYRRKY